MIEPAHEALLRQWGLLQGWLQEDFAALTTLETVKRAARDWAANVKREDWLAHRSGRLEDALKLLLRHDLAGKLDSADREYLDACKQREEVERAEKSATLERELSLQKIARVRARRTSLAAAMVAVVMTGIGGFAYWQKTMADAATASALHEKARADENAIEGERHAAEARSQRDRAKAQRNVALMNDSRRLAALAEQRLSVGEAAQAALLAVEGLPGSSVGSDDRPYLGSLEEVLFRSLPQVRDLAILSKVSKSPSGKYLASSENDTISVYDSENGARLSALDSPGAKLVTFDPDERLIATSSAGDVRVWKLPTGPQVMLFSSPNNTIVDRMAFYEKGVKFWTSSTDGALRLWSIDNGRLLKTLVGHESQIFSMDISPDGRRVVTITENNIFRLFDADTEREVANQQLPSRSRASFSPDGRWILISTEAKDSDEAIVLDALDASEIGRYPSSWSTFYGRFLLVQTGLDTNSRLIDLVKRKIVIQDLSDEARIIANANFVLWKDGRNNAPTKIWDTNSGEIIAELDSNGRYHWEQFVPGDDKIVSYSSDAIRIWDPQGRKPVCSISTGEAIEGLIINPSLPRGVLQIKNRQELRDLQSCRLMRSLATLERRERYSWAFSDDGRRMASYTYREPQPVKIWDGETGDEIPGPPAAGSVTKIEFNDEGDKLAVSYEDRGSIVWDTNSETQTTSFEDTDRFEFSPRGESLHFTSEYPKENYVTRIVSTRKRNSLTGAYSNGLGKAVTIDKSVAVTIAATKAEDRPQDPAGIYSFTTGKLISELKGQRKGLRSVVLADNGQRILTFSEDNTARIWNSVTSDLIASVRAEILSLTSNKWLLARVDEADIEIWNVHDGTLLRRLSNVFSKFSGLQLASLSDDGAVLLVRGPRTSTLWNVVEGRVVSQLDSVRVAQVSSDGRRVYVWYQNKSASLLDASSGKKIAEWPKPVDALLSDDGQLIVVFDGEYGHVCDTDTGNEISRFKSSLTYIMYGSVSSKAKAAYFKTADGAVDVWNLNTGARLLSLPHASSKLNPLFDPTGETFVTIESNSALLRNAKDGGRVTEIAVGQAETSAIAFSKDASQLFVASENGEARIFDARTGNLLTHLKILNAKDPIVRAQFNFDGSRILTTSKDRTVRLWDAKAGTELSAFDTPSFDRVSVEVIPQSDNFVLWRSRQFVAGLDKIRLWNSVGGFKGAVQAAGEVASLAVSLDGRFMSTATRDGTLQLWDMSDLRQTLYVNGDETPFSGRRVEIVWAQDGSRFVRTVLSNQQLQIDSWNANDFKKLFSRKLDLSRTHVQQRFSTALTSDKKLLSLIMREFDGPLHLFVVDSATGEVSIDSDMPNTSNTDVVKINKSGTRVLVLPDRHSKDGQAPSLWDVSDGSRVSVFDDVHNAAVGDFSPDGQLLVMASAEGPLRAWDSSTGMFRRLLRQNLGEPVGVAFSNNGRYLVLLTKEAKDKTAIGNAPRAPNDPEFASTIINERVFDLESSDTANIEVGGATSASSRIELDSAAVSDDGSTLVTVSHEGTIDIWARRAVSNAGGEVLVLVGSLTLGRGRNLDQATPPVFSADGKLVLLSSRSSSIAGSASNGLFVRIYSSVKELIELVESTIPRCLTPKERKQFFLDPSPPLWCVEMKKWPYQTSAWKDWLAETKAGNHPSLPTQAGSHEPTPR